MEKKLYDLTQGQQLILLGLKYTKYKEIANIAVELEVDNDIDLHLLMQAAYLAIHRNPNNCIRITEKDKKKYQYFSNEAQDKIDYFEFDSEKDYEAYIQKFASTQFPNKGLDTQLYNLDIIKKPNNKIAICGCFNHMIYDTYSAVSLFREILLLYKAVKNNEPLPKESISPMAAYEEEKKYLQSNRFLKDKEFFDSEFSSEPHYTILSGTKSKAYKKKANYGLRPMFVDMKSRANTYVAQ